MKKLMMMLFVAVAAVSLQANTCSWSVVINGASTAGVTPAGWTAYFLDTSSFDGKQSSLDAALSSASFTSNAAKIETGAVDFATSAASINYSVVLVHDGQYSVLKTGSYTPYGAMDPASSVTVSLTAKNAIGTGTAPISWTPIEGGGTPEPTSGLLLLVGGAMLALRRKQK